MRTLTPAEEINFLRALDARYTAAPYYIHPTIHVNDTFTLWRNTRDLLCALLMLDSGLRVGELLGLTISDLFFSGAPVSFLTVRPEISKSKHSRNIPISERIKKTLEIYTTNTIYTQTIYPDKKLIVKTPSQNSFTARAIEYTFRKASLRSIGWPVHPHCLRHTFATKLLQKTNIRTVQELLGHVALSSTQIYTHVNDQDKIAAIANLE